jgi:hypothetical protein
MARLMALALIVAVGACSGDTPPEAVVPVPPAVASDDPSAEHLPGGITTHYSETDNVEVDESGHGAVLCAWSIYVGILYVGKTCFPDDKETHSLLSGEITRIDRFIMKNSPTTREQIERAKAEMPYFDKPAKCGDGRDAWLQALFKGYGADPQSLRAEVDDLLSVPRKPVMSPCL